jgi:catechol 2,3-dioxygenase-like lactoylglutathione lyase family enzyme
MVPVADQDRAIEFYTKKLGFSLASDVPFGDGARWVEVAPPAGGANLALVPPHGDSYQTGRITGIALETTDARGDREAMAADGIDLDGDLMGGDGTVPLLFSIRDIDGNSLMIVEQ